MLNFHKMKLTNSNIINVILHRQSMELKFQMLLSERLIITKLIQCICLKRNSYFLLNKFF
jgi:hypothetical protein